MPQRTIPTSALKASGPALTPGTTPWIEALMDRMEGRDFGDTPAMEVEVPPPDSDYLRGKELLGVRILFYSIDNIAPKSFNGAPAKVMATYSIYLHGRADLGLRKLSLGSRMAIAQAESLMENNSLPRFGTLGLDDPIKGEYASIIVEPDPIVGVKYYHKPWSEKPEPETAIEGTVEEYPL